MTPEARSPARGAPDRAAARRDAAYVESAVDLHNCVVLNEEDDDFVGRRHGQIRYVFDANVVRFYLNPFARDEYSRVSLFGGDRVDDARALAVATAEFLFSGDLCGQWNMRPMISRWHAAELESHARALGDIWTARLNRGARDGAAAPDDDFEDFVQKVSERSSSLAALRDSIDRMESPLAGVGDLMQTEAFEARQFGLMMRERLIRSLHLDPLAARMRFDPGAGDLRDLAAAKAALSGGDRAPDARDFADAQSLMMVAALNREAAARDPSQPVRYVLVTTDGALYNCAMDVFGGSKRRGQADWMPVRRLAQFVPYLNTRQIPNNVSSGALMPQIRTALDDFLVINGISPAGEPRALPRAAPGARGRADGPLAEGLAPVRDARRALSATPQYEAKLAELSALWARLGRESVLLNAGLIGRRVDGFLSLSAILEEAEDVRASLHRVMLDTVAEVERGHLVLGVEHYLTAEIADIRARVGEGDGHGAEGRRGMPILRARFDGLVEGAEPLRFFEDIFRRSDKVDLHALLRGIGRAAPDEAYFFSGCVAFMASSWDNAVHFMRRAIEKSGGAFAKSDMADENGDLAALDRRYLLLLSRRFQVMDAHVTEVRRLEMLEALHGDAADLLVLAEQMDDAFEESRAELELAMLELSLAYLSGLVRGAQGAEAADETAEQAWRRLSFVVRRLPQARDLCGEETFRYLVVELCTALTGYLTHRVFVSARDHQELLRQSEVLLADIGQVMSAGAIDLPDIYRQAPAFVGSLLRSAEDMEAAREGARAQLRGSLDGGAALTRMDRAVMRHLIATI